MKRTNVYADSADLNLIKETARQRGIPEAEIIRQGIHLAAMSNRVWDEPLEWSTFEGDGVDVTDTEITETVSRNMRLP